MKKGFTLIELLAIIIILAIIAGIAVPIVLNIVEDSRKSASKSAAGMVLSATHTYYYTEVFRNSDDFTAYSCMISNKTGCPEILLQGDRPDTAVINIAEDGNINGSVTFGKYTYWYCDNSLSEVDCGSIKTALQIGYTNDLSNNNCTTVKCALDELFEELN